MGHPVLQNETCCQGLLLKYAENDNEDFVPVVKHTSIRTFLSNSASRGLHIQHLKLSCMGTSKYTWHSHHDLMNLEKKALGCYFQNNIYGPKSSMGIE